VRLLDHSLATEVAEIVGEALEEAGYQDRTEIIPGLIQAVINYADDHEQILDEAANLLADGGVRD